MSKCQQKKVENNYFLPKFTAVNGENLYYLPIYLQDCHKNIFNQFYS
jgi:hypothetical protein